MFIDILRSKVMDNLSIFEPDYQEILRISRPENLYTDTPLAASSSILCIFGQPKKHEMDRLTDGRTNTPSVSPLTKIFNLPWLASLLKKR